MLDKNEAPEGCEAVEFVCYKDSCLLCCLKDGDSDCANCRPNQRKDETNVYFVKKEKPMIKAETVYTWNGKKLTDLTEEEKAEARRWLEDGNRPVVPYQIDEIRTALAPKSKSKLLADALSKYAGFDAEESKQKIKEIIESVYGKGE